MAVIDMKGSLPFSLFMMNATHSAPKILFPKHLFKFFNGNTVHDAKIAVLVTPLTNFISSFILTLRRTQSRFSVGVENRPAMKTCDGFFRYQLSPSMIAGLALILKPILCESVFSELINRFFNFATLTSF
jgi:hypothetical protein